MLTTSRSFRLTVASSHGKTRSWMRSSTFRRPRPAGLAFTRLPTRTFATQVHDKPYYVTTPIFYVNAAPHVGHLYAMVLADILKRWALFRGRTAFLCTGTDEHGMKVQRAATKAGVEPKPFCDKASEIYKSLAARANISNDHFIRTTDDDHKEAVQFAWMLLKERGYIYLSRHEGWYAVSDETFYPQSKVHMVLEPQTGRKIMASIETGKEVEWSSEENYRFRLSDFKKPLLNYYQKHRDWILPSSRMENVIRDVAAGLEDLSISRPTSRLNWGIRVPGDESHTIYVWLDALINYITKAGYPWPPEKSSTRGWPADCQVIGKEIVRFHCIYWPAFLMALGIPLPKRILTHSHWTLGREKMSKSIGNVVDPFFAMSRFGVDTIRFYLAHDGSLSDDTDYSNETIISRYKKTLKSGLGNLASRITRGKAWSVRDSVRKLTDELKQHHSPQLEQPDEPKITTVKEAPTPEIDAEEKPHLVQEAILGRCPRKFVAHMDGHDIHAATKYLMTVVAETNKYVQIVQPWTLAEKKSEHEERQLARTIFNCAEALRLTALLLQPVMPTDMTRLLDMLGVDTSRRTFTYAHFGADSTYGESKADLGSGFSGVLFPPLNVEE